MKLSNNIDLWQAKLQLTNTYGSAVVDLYYGNLMLDGGSGTNNYYIGIP